MDKDMFFSVLQNKDSKDKFFWESPDFCYLSVSNLAGAEALRDIENIRRCDGDSMVKFSSTFFFNCLLKSYKYVVCSLPCFCLTCNLPKYLTIKLVTYLTHFFEFLLLEIYRALNWGILTLSELDW